MVTVEFFIVRTKLVYNILNGIPGKKQFFCGKKKYTEKHYRHVLSSFVKKHGRSERISPSECEVVTLTSVTTIGGGGKKEIYSNPFSITQNSDLDTTFYLVRDTEALFSSILRHINEIHERGISLVKNLDTNLYIEDKDSIYLKLLKGATDSDVKRYHDAIFLKLFRHGVISGRRARELVTSSTKTSTTKIYRSFENEASNSNVTKSLLQKEGMLYIAYIDKAREYIKNPSLESLFYFQTLKLEGYVSVATLMFYLHPTKIKDDRLLNIAVLENLADSLIHLSSSNHIKKAKYLFRITNAMNASAVNCSKKQRTQVEILTEFSRLFDRVRKHADDFSDFDATYRNLAMMILHQIDPSVGMKFDLQKISKGGGTLTANDVKKSTLKVLLSKRSFACNKNAA